MDIFYCFCLLTFPLALYMVDFLPLLYLFYLAPVSFPFYIFCLCRSPFNMSIKQLIWWCWTPSFCLSVKLLTFPSNLNESFVSQSILGCRLFLSSLQVYQPLLSGLQEFLLKSQPYGNSLVGNLLLFPYHSLIFSLIFAILLIMCLLWSSWS